MENMNQLKDLLKHEIKDLYSAEEQIIEALPKMIEKAKNKSLKKALEEHLQVTEQQKERLDQVLAHLSEEGEEEKENKGGFLGLFKGKEKCKAMEGLIVEGEKLMKEDMSPEVMDAAIIAAAQKIEHYEIASYGTVRAYAEELDLDEVEALLKETLDEEYEADDLLTELAESRLNEKAISGSGRVEGRSGSRKISANGNGKTSRSSNKATAKASATRGSSSTTRSSRNGGAPAKKAASPRSKSNSSKGRASGKGRN